MKITSTLGVAIYLLFASVSILSANTWNCSVSDFWDSNKASKSFRDVNLSKKFIITPGGTQILITTICPLCENKKFQNFYTVIEKKAFLGEVFGARIELGLSTIAMMTNPSGSRHATIVRHTGEYAYVWSLSCQ